MTEHPTKQELDDYRGRVLAPGEFLSVHRHVTACPSCSAQCNSTKDLTRDFDDLNTALLHEPDDTPYHLSAAEVRAYTQGTLDEIDLEIAESHLGVCSTCLSEVQRQEVVHVEPAAFKPRSFVNWWQPWRIAAVVSLGILLMLFTIWLLRSKPVEHNGQADGPSNLSSPESSPASVVQAPTVEQPSTGADVVLVLNDGNYNVTLDKQGTLAGLEQLPSSIKQRIQVALQTGKLEPSSALAQLNSQSSDLRGESGNGLPFRLIGPLREIVRSEQPTFRWHALGGAQSYTVTVTDADLNEIVTSPPLSTTEWQISKPLKAGGIYSWQVTALKEGARITSPVLPAPQAKFRVIDRSTSEMLQQAQRAYPDSHLTLGVLYAEAGFLDEAEKELQALARDNPNDRTVLKLLQQVKAMRRR